MNFAHCCRQVTSFPERREKGRYLSSIKDAIRIKDVILNRSFFRATIQNASRSERSD